MRRPTNTLALVLTTLTLSLSGGALALSTAGCASAAEAPATATSESAATKAPVAPQAHGPVRFLGDALAAVPLRPEQRAEIEKLAADAETRQNATRVTGEAVALELAAQIERGTLDHNAIQAKVDATLAQIEASRPADRAAFQRLHAILDPEQRNAFVDEIEAKIQEKKDSRGGPLARSAGMLTWAHDLKLTEEQTLKIKEAMRAKIGDVLLGKDDGEPSGAPAKDGRAHAGPRGPHAHGKPMLDAFRRSDFAIDRVAPPGDLRAHANVMGPHVFSLAETVLPILTTEQRTIAATKIREKVAAGAAVMP